MFRQICRTIAGITTCVVGGILLTNISSNSNHEIKSEEKIVRIVKPISPEAEEARIAYMTGLHKQANKELADNPKSDIYLRLITEAPFYFGLLLDGYGDKADKRIAETSGDPE